MTLDIITSEVFQDIRHGFFSRVGGVSSGLFESLNCGAGSGDQADFVAVNRARVANSMEVAPDRIATVHQVHSADVLYVRELSLEERPKADAIVTDIPGVAIAVLTADCQPVLFADRKSKVIGAAHAGWKGALDGVLEATINAMVALGAERGRIVAAIGPAISQRAYEVGPEFLDRFRADDEGNARFFANGEGDRYLFDLPGYGLHRLREAGVGKAEWTGHCTYSDEARFFSYRRSVHLKEGDYGRLISAVRL